MYTYRSLDTTMPRPSTITTGSQNISWLSPRLPCICKTNATTQPCASQFSLPLSPAQWLLQRIHLPLLRPFSLSSHTTHRFNRWMLTTSCTTRCDLSTESLTCRMSHPRLSLLPSRPCPPLLSFDYHLVSTAPSASMRRTVTRFCHFSVWTMLFA